ncbi:cell adhesion molecule Dscam2 isoform X2 [Bicyclus anynana]|uniref:Cell adhesion molecule Dscam2 isoform X2 n=1 Tax=Bicyclus anynana TaxID=110368 RepID=A0ABM3LGA5_BICAN|nr:cell adhesion molecule Dscam2 isoform X2 [Bicyclus anynana]
MKQRAGSATDFVPIVNLGGRFQFLTNGTLWIEAALAYDEGYYMCKAENGVGTPLSKTIFVAINEPARFEVTSHNVSARRDAGATLACEARGDAPLRLAWSRDGAPLDLSTYRLSISEAKTDSGLRSQLYISRTDRQDSGVYKCQAVNAYGHADHYIYLSVQEKPETPQSLSVTEIQSRAVRLSWSLRFDGNSPLLGYALQYTALSAQGAIRVSHWDGATTVNVSLHGTHSHSHVTYVHYSTATRRCWATRCSTRRCRRRAPSASRTGTAPPPSTCRCTAPTLTRTSRTFITRRQLAAAGLRAAVHGAVGAGRHPRLALGRRHHRQRVAARHPLSLARHVRSLLDGNSPLLGYTLQYTALSAQGAIRVSHWDGATTVNVSLHGTHSHSHVTLTKKGDIHYEALLSSLRPHTAYMIRIAAVNQIDHSAYTEAVVVKTQEEAPSEAPSGVSVSAGAAGELLVAWRAPPRDAWHGELLGYSVACAELGPDAVPLPNSTRTLTVNGWSATELTLSALKKFTRYEVRVRAFNGVAAGPASAPVTATTLEGVPEAAPTRVTCSALSSSSIKVSWAPPPPAYRNGIIQGYKIIYAPLSTSHAEGAEIKRVSTTETYLHALHKYSNYSLQVAAYTAAGDGKRSAPAYCMTDEDVPSAPEKIKALPYSSDSVLVSWLPPVHPNGVISHYTVYYREAGRLGKHLSFTVSADNNPEVELMFQVRNLMEKQRYEFWVSATTGSGEGEATLVVGQGPSSRISAGIASFGGERRVGAGRGALLACAAVGAPAPRTRWAHAHAPVTHHRYYQVTRSGHLHIREVNEQSSGNFTCTATNSIGEDSIVYVVKAVLPPGAPQLSLQYTTATSIKLHWSLPTSDIDQPVLGYILQYKQASETEWHSIELSPEQTSYTMDMLKCGTTYNAKIQAQNKISLGPSSEVLTATTRGGRPKAPKAEEHVHTNATAIKINLYAWRDAGCPILGFRVAYRRAGDDHWIQAGAGLSAARHVVGALAPGAWYEVAVEAWSDAGVERVTLLADTHTLAGGRIPPLRAAPPPSGARTGAMRTALVWCAASALVVVGALAAILCVLHAKRKFFCLSNDHYLRDNRKLSESNEAEREKLREGHKLYSSSSINGNEKSNDDSSAELYEISPYATFGGGAAAHSLQFRTLARRDDDAAPPHRRRRRACDHYRYVEARHRLRAAPAPAPTPAPATHWRERSDSDDYSDSAANTTTKGSGGSGGGSAYGSGRRTASSGGQNGSDGLSGVFAPVPPDISSLIDKYQQRKEQERRECTIHV